MTDSEKGTTRRSRTAASEDPEPEAAATEAQPEDAQAPEDQPDPGQPPPPEPPPEPQEGELPVERLLTDEAEPLVGAPAHEVAGALALAGIDAVNVKTDEVEQALAAYRAHVPADSTHPEGQEA